jgi:putative ABC transport system permease protein
MVRHLFKLIWNRKKQNALLITEIFVSFLVMFGIFTMIVYYYKNYKQPMGFDYNNVWVVNFASPENITRKDSMILFKETLKNNLRSMPQIQEVSFTANNVPFSMNTANGSVFYNGQAGVMTNFYNAGEDFPKVLGIQMKEGRWYTKADEGSKIPAVVITAKLEKDLFKGQPALGKVIGEENTKMKVIGVMEDIKDKGSYQDIEAGLYQPIDSSSGMWVSTILLKVKPGTDAAFESRLFKTLSNAIGTNVEIEHMDNKLVTKNKLMMVPMIIAFVVAGFLLINVALGLFGVLWYNINKRKGEIGLRRAVGASGRSVSGQLVGEALVISTISVIIGCFFAFQFPLLNVFDLEAGTYISAILLSILFIYLLVLACAIYPGRQAAAIYPAVALHEE